MNPTSFAVIIPTYYEEENILALVYELQQKYSQVQIIVVDDSENMPEALYSELSGLGIHLFCRKVRSGRGDAVYFGMKKALEIDVEYFVQMDADFSHSPAEVKALVEKLVNDKLSMVLASRYRKSSRILNWSALRKINSYLSNIICRLVFSFQLSDYTNGFRAYNRKTMQLLLDNRGNFKSDGFSLLIEELVFVLRRGEKIGEISSIFINRDAGESKLNFKEFKSAALSLWHARRF